MANREEHGAPGAADDGSALRRSTRLRATARAAWRILWGLAFAASLLATLAGAYRDLAVPSAGGEFSRLGMRISRTSLEVYASVGAADRSGVRLGDRIVAVDGVPVRNGATLAELRHLLRGPDGKAVRIAMRSRDGTRREHVLVRDIANHGAYYREWYGMDEMPYRALEMAVLLPTALLLLGAALLLFRTRQHDRVAGALSLAFIGLAAVSGPGVGIVYDPAAAGWGDLLFLLSWSTFIALLPVFPDGRFVPRWTRWLMPAFLLAPLASLLGWLPGMTGTVVGMANMAAGIGVLILRYRALPPGDQRQQIRWALFGFALGTAALTLWLLNELGAPAIAATGWRGASALASLLLSSLGLTAFALGLMVSLVRYRLYDADAAISRSAAYAVMTVGLVLVFACSEKVIELVSERYFEGDAGIISGGIGAGLAAVLIGPLHNRIHRWAERRFQGALIRLRRDLPERLGDLRETAPMPVLLDDTLARIERAVRSQRSAILVRGAVAHARGVAPDVVASWRGGVAEPIETVERTCDPLFPLRVRLGVSHDYEGRPTAELLLGPRPDGSPPGKDESKAVAAVADSLARAIWIVEARESRAADERVQREAQAARIDALESLAARLADALGLQPRPG